MNTNLLAIILLTAFLVVNIIKRLHTASLISKINSDTKLSEDLLLQKSS